MANPIFTLTGKKPADTYPNLVQFDTSSMNFMDGLGNSLSASTVQVTASYAATASYAFTQLGPEVSSSHALRADNSDNTISASFAGTALVADSVATAGFANNATSASFASSALNADNATSASWAPYVDTGTTLYTGSTYEVTSSWTNNVVSSSFAGTALNADNANSAGFATNAGFSTSGSSAGYANTSSWSDYANIAGGADVAAVATSASWASSSLSASWAPAPVAPSTSSFALFSDSASWAPYVDTAGTTLYTASTYPITSSWAEWATNIATASFALSAGVAISTPSATSSSYATRADSVDDLYQYVSISPAAPQTPGLESLLVQSVTASAARFIQTAVVNDAPNYNAHVVRIIRDFGGVGAPQTGDLLSLACYETGSSANILRATMRDGAGVFHEVFVVDASGSITGSRLNGTASWADNSISASYAPTVTIGLTETRSWVTTLDTQSMYLSNGLVVSWSVQA